MADYTSNVIVDISLNAVDARARATELSRSIVELRDQQDQLRSSGLQLGNTYRQNAQQIRTLESETRAYLNIANSQNGSINSLRAQIVLLNNQYNELSAAERNSTTAGQALQRQLLALRNEERAASQAAGNFSTNIGNYTQSILQATGVTGGFANGLIQAVQGVNSLSAAFAGSTTAMRVFQVALASTGIGAVILLVGSLIAYLKDLDTVTDGLAQNTSGLGAAFQELGRQLINDPGQNRGSALLSAIEAFKTARDLTAQQQALEDSVLAQSVKSARTQAEVAKLAVEARNRTLDPAERAKLLAESERLDADDLKAKESNAKKETELAFQAIERFGRLTKEQKTELRQRGVDYALYLQNNLTDQGKVTDLQTKNLAKALNNQTQIQQEYTQRSEKRQNLADRVADQADRKAEAAEAKAEALRQRRLNEQRKIEEDLVKSRLNTAQATLTIRQKEYADINADIDKRKLLYQQYGFDTIQLERERLSRISALNAQFRQQDLSTIRSNTRATTGIRTGLITNPQQRKQQQLDDAIGFSLEDIDAQMLAVAARIALGEQGLTEVLQSYANQRLALVDKSNQDQAQLDDENREHRLEVERNAQDAAYQNQLDAFNREAELNQQRLQINDALISSYESLAGSVVDLAGKTTAAGKIAFVAQKAFAIAQILINGAAARAQIIYRYEILKTQAVLASSLAGPFAVFAASAAIAALSAAEAGELTANTIGQIAQVAGVAATTIGQFASGGMVSGPGTGTSDSIPARLSNGESVMTAQATRMFAPILSQMNVAGGGVPFATGGIAGSFVPTLSNSTEANNAVSRAITGSLGGMKIVTYVEDINYQQDKFNANIEAANF